MRTITVLCVTIVALLFVRSSMAANSVSLDSVAVAFGADSIASETPIVFNIRMSFDNYSYWGIANGFRVYSPDSCTWDTLTAGWTGAIVDSMLPTQYQLCNYFSIDGSGADTVGFSAFIWTDGSGIPPYFDAVVCSVSVGPIPAVCEGKTICIDSSFYPPANRWRWVTSIDSWNVFAPTWDGPHCFTVAPEPDCCTIRGDTNHDGIGPAIDDLLYLSNYIVNGGAAPPCLSEADVNGDSIEGDIADLVYLQTYMFNSGPAPVACP